MTDLTPTEQEADRNAAEARAAKRLVVDLTRRTRADLAWLVEIEEMNKTTVVNRAVQLYRLIVETQQNGGHVLIGDERLVIV